MELSIPHSEQIAAEFMDRSVCAAERTADAVERLIQPPQEAERAVRPNAPSFRTLAVAPRGELAGQNVHRTGFYLHNASDGALLIRYGAEPATPRAYTLVVGPGEVFSTAPRVASELTKGPIQYAFLAPTAEDGDEWDLSVFPAGIMPVATAGALSFTELALKPA